MDNNKNSSSQLQKFRIEINNKIRNNYNNNEIFTELYLKNLDFENIQNILKEIEKNFVENNFILLLKLLKKLNLNFKNINYISFDIIEFFF